mmetsp:Transcript_24651/g.48021  ORF Transcript_24651/g.48021 Transcript_24651/m.48021 type:complete len:214 (+) Transcript_24651:50-691(+)
MALEPADKKGENKDTQVEWKGPVWQQEVTPARLELAVHPDGPLSTVHREAYLQKKAGKLMRMRWNIRYFELKDGILRWWRPRFKDQVMQPGAPRLALAEPRPKPSKELDMTKVKSVTRTKVKFPYSSRILIKWQEQYTNYELELRHEKEIEIMAWYKIFVRFTMETYEVEAPDGEEETEVGDGHEDDDSDSEDESSFHVMIGAPGATSSSAAA